MSDPIGFDPVAWVDRLREVNRDSQFTTEERATIDSYLKELAQVLKLLSRKRGVREES